jgi:hypothetical protein
MHMGWSMSDRADKISNMRFVVSMPSAMLVPPTVPELPVTLALRVPSFVWAARSGLRTGAGDGEGGSSIDSDMCTSMNDMAGFWGPAPC